MSKDDIRYTCLKAFIEGDNATLAEINAKSLPIEAYDIYKTVEIGKYTITYQENPNDSSGDVIFHANIISSGVSYYPVGEHSFIAYNGIDGNYIKNPQITQRIEYNTEAQETLFKWLVLSRTYELYDYNSLQGEFLEAYSYWITDYLQYTFRDDNVV